LEPCPRQSSLSFLVKDFHDRIDRALLFDGVRPSNPALPSVQQPQICRTGSCGRHFGDTRQSHHISRLRLCRWGGLCDRRISEIWFCFFEEPWAAYSPFITFLPIAPDCCVPVDVLCGSRQSRECDGFSPYFICFERF